MSTCKGKLCDALARIRRRIAKLRFRCNESGAAAVDFALVLLPFLMVLMAIIESGLVLLAGSVLDTATANSARLILTGQAQSAGWSVTQFKNSVCANLTVMFNCSGALYIDVEHYSSFSSISLPAVTDANGNLLPNNFNFSPGNPGDIVVVRLIYQWPIFASALGIGLVNGAGNTYTLVSTAAFRNEPY